MATKRRILNLKIIESNLSEAIEELKKLRDGASNGELEEGSLQVGLLHSYHHLNFAWNTRYLSTTQYDQLTHAQFDRWGKYPSEIEHL